MTIRLLPVFTQRSAFAAATFAVAFASASGCLSVAPHLKRAPAVTAPDPVDVETQVSTDFAEVNGAWLRVRSDSPARAVGEDAALPVVFVHGFGSRLEAFRHLQPAVAKTRRTLAFDQRGFGESERVAGSYGPDGHAQDLLEIIRLAGFERVVLVGHSYGGGVAARAALLAPEVVAGVVLIDAFLLDRQVPQSFRWAKAPVVGELLFGAFYKEVPGEKYLLAFHDRERFVTAEALDEMQRIMAKPGSVHAALETVRGMNYAEWNDRLDHFEPPSLVLWGEQDRVTPLAQGEAIATRLDSDKLVIIRGAGHMPLWERPNAVHTAIVPFLAKVDAIERSRPTAADLPDTDADALDTERPAQQTGDADATNGDQSQTNAEAFEPNSTQEVNPEGGTP